MLRAAEDILPRVTALEDEFSGLVKGSSGRLHIAIECHACFDWLFPVLEQFRKAWPDVDVDIRPVWPSMRCQRCGARRWIW